MLKLRSNTIRKIRGKYFLTYMHINIKIAYVLIISKQKNEKKETVDFYYCYHYVIFLIYLDTTLQERKNEEEKSQIGIKSYLLTLQVCQWDRIASHFCCQAA